MVYSANIFQVIIVSPGDVPRERQLAKEIVLEWNAVNSRDKKISLMPVGWEHNTSPEMGDRGQEFINKQILLNSDLLIGIFWTRIGSPTGESISGSVEEIEKHIETGKPTMLYFSNAPVVPGSIDLVQFGELKKFKDKCITNGLVENFESPEDFRTKLSRQLSLKIIQHEYFRISTDFSEHEVLETNQEFELLNNLTDNEKLIVIEASEDTFGRIMKISHKGGFIIQTNRKQLNEDFAPRTAALWESAFKSLINKDLIEEKGNKGEVFALTLLGFKVADLLKADK